jgi:hypothetical protein
MAFLLVRLNNGFEFHKRSQLFIRTHNETLSVAMHAYDSPSAHSA